jgi:hypothetical protein
MSKIFREAMDVLNLSRHETTRRDTTFTLILPGELAGVYMAAVEDWKWKLHQVINKYPQSNQFNTEKTGLFYRKMPRKSFIQTANLIKVGKDPRKDYVFFSVVVPLVKI